MKGIYEMDDELEKCNNINSNLKWLNENNYDIETYRHKTWFIDIITNSDFKKKFTKTLRKEKLNRLFNENK